MREITGPPGSNHRRSTDPGHVNSQHRTLTLTSQTLHCCWLHRLPRCRLHVPVAACSLAGCLAAWAVLRTEGAAGKAMAVQLAAVPWSWACACNQSQAMRSSADHDAHPEN